VGGSINFSVDTSEFKKLAKLFNATSEFQKASARMLGDMAWDNKTNIQKEIADYYTIRDNKLKDPKAVKPFFFVERPKASTPIDQQKASSGTMRIDSGSGGLFTGFEEELTGKPRELRAKSGRYHRGIGPNAREGGSMEGRVLGQYRLGRSSDRIPNSFDYPELSPRQFMAMVLKSSASGQSKRAKHFKTKDYATGKNKVFILSGPDGPGGLFGAMPDGKIKKMQTFHERPVESEYKFDWQGAAAEQTQRKFTPDYVWERYLAPAINALFGKK
jgi:hypothetical protein